MANTFNREIAKKSEPHRRTLKQISVNTVKKRLVTAVLLTA